MLKEKGSGLLLPTQPEGQKVAETAAFITFIKPLGRIEKMLDRALNPFMKAQLSKDYRAQTPYPHETHLWHAQILTPEEITTLDPNLMASGVVDSNASRAGLEIGIPNPLTHVKLPLVSELLPQWEVMETLQVDNPHNMSWHLGWLAHGDNRADAFQVSRLEISGDSPFIRVIAGPTQVQFFALAANGCQLPLRLVEISSAKQSSLRQNEPMRRL